MSRLPPARFPGLVACPDCDLLQRPITAPRGGSSVCARCLAVLDRGGDDDVPLALALAALLMLMLANAFPIVTLTVQGQQTEATLIDTVGVLWAQDMQSLALLVAFTTIVAPALEAIAATYVLLVVRTGQARSRLAAFALRVFRGVDEWSMTEVFMLGALVALVKLRDYAEVDFGVALWCLGGAMFLLAAMGASFDVQAAWRRLEPRR